MTGYQKFAKTTCERCGGTTNLQVHHIDINHHNNDPNNLTTLCKTCHDDVHMEVRRAKNPMRKYWRRRRSIPSTHRRWFVGPA